MSRFAELRDLLAPLHAALFAESNPIPLKAALARLKLRANEVRAYARHAATDGALAAVLECVMREEEQIARQPKLALAS